KFLPIWIGHPEAAAILMKLQSQTSVRPMTHDLVSDMLEQLGASISRITVTELRENTFYAQITVIQDGQEVEVDSRPSDAIALARAFPAGRCPFGRGARPARCRTGRERAAPRRARAPGRRRRRRGQSTATAPRSGARTAPSRERSAPRRTARPVRRGRSSRRR